MILIPVFYLYCRIVRSYSNLRVLPCHSPITQCVWKSRLKVASHWAKSCCPIIPVAWCSIYMLFDFCISMWESWQISWQLLWLCYADNKLKTSVTCDMKVPSSLLVAKIWCTVSPQLWWIYAGQSCVTVL